MQNILIINLDGPDKILSTATFVYSLNSYFPNSKISYLSYHEDKNFIKLLPSIDNLFLIERKKIKTFLKGKIFPDAQAINSLDKTLENVSKINWESIIHIGTSLEGAIISAYINNKFPNSNFYGLKLGNSKVLHPSNIWFLIQESIKDYKFNPLNSIEYLHFANNFFFDPQIPKRKGASKKIGILLPTNPEDNFLPFQSIVELIDLLKGAREYFPVLIVDFQNINREYFNKINRYFNYELEIQYLNFENVRKTMALLDCLITTSSSIKYLAQMEGSLVIEITDSICNSQIGPKNISIIKGPERVKGLDLFNCIEEKYFLNSPDIQLFSCLQDRIGYRLQRLNGKFKFNDEISRLMSRYLIGALYLQERDEVILSDIAEFPQKEISCWIETEKNLAMEISSKILNTLRLLSLIGEGETFKKDLIVALDDLLSFSNSENLIVIPILIFKYKIENSPVKDLKTLENETFLLKDQVQTVISSIRDLENETWNKKKDSLIKKAFGERSAPIEEISQ